MLLVRGRGWVKERKGREGQDQEVFFFIYTVRLSNSRSPNSGDLCIILFYFISYEATKDYWVDMDGPRTSWVVGQRGPWTISSFFVFFSKIL